MDLDILRRFALHAVRASTNGSTGPHITRYAMYKRLSGVSASWNLGRRIKVLSISHSESLCAVLNLQEPQLDHANFPEQNVLNLQCSDGKYDLVLADQVLEHVRGSPHEAITECFRAVRSGGIVVHTTCFINPIHDAPGDYWRFTPAGLALMAEQHGDLLESGGWGNPYVWIAIALGLRFEQVPDDKDHFLNALATANDPQWPIVTWVVARKA